MLVTVWISVLVTVSINTRVEMSVLVTSRFAVLAPKTPPSATFRYLLPTMPTGCFSKSNSTDFPISVFTTQLLSKICSGKRTDSIVKHCTARFIFRVPCLDSIQTCHHSDRLRISNFNIRFLKRYLRVSITNFNSKMIRFRIRCLYLNDLYKGAVEDCLGD